MRRPTVVTRPVTCEQHWPRTGGVIGIQAYQREELPDEQDEAVVFLGRRTPVLDERHDVRLGVRC